MPDSPPIAAFLAKWQRAELSERAASQEHFIDLCRLLGQPTPAEHDATGAEYTFEKGVAATGGSGRRPDGDRGFADVWWRGKFGWEYKRKGKYRDLREAYEQLLRYREALENPPLLVVCDIARIEIHTNFTGTKKEIHTIELGQLGHPDNLAKLRRVFTDPESFKPTLTTWKLTEQVAADFAKIADWLRQRKHDPHTAAHFLMKCAFCLFAEDVKLLPDRLFTKLLERGRDDPDKLTGRLTELFKTMRSGGDFGTESIDWFNGGLFDESPALKLNATEINTMLVAAQHDWGAVEPAIFGTLFERSLDESKRSQIGAHYTSREDILLIVEPVVMAPLRREWKAVQSDVQALLAKRRDAAGNTAKAKVTAAIGAMLDEFLHRLSSVRILDPACGSGNFLYVAIQELLNLEKEVIVFAGRPEIGIGLFPRVRPTQLHGIEINPFAAELAQVVIWIGFLQWMRENGFAPPREPILESLKSIEHRDAILDFTIPTKPQSANWPEADFIIGNPPFLGDKLLRGFLGDQYVEDMRAVYDRVLPGQADLCCYWFELARRRIESKPHTRCGLLATQNIRGGGSRVVLERIKETGDIFYAHSDRDWILEGANVHVSLIGFDSGRESVRELDNERVTVIHADLTSDLNTTTANALVENRSLGFLGSCKGGPFDIELEKARKLLALAGNPNGRPNTDVLRPVMNSRDLLARTVPRWIIDNADLSLQDACKYSGPHAVVEKLVKPVRDANRDKWLRENWWRPQRMRPEMRNAAFRLDRFFVTPTTAKHRIFQWTNQTCLPDHQLIVFARSDDYFFGVLHSSIHELWALRMGTQLEDRPRYTPTTCFETFPLPWPPGKEPVKHPVYAQISEAARDLNEQRERWLNPPEWLAPIERLIDARDDFADVPAEARPLIRNSAIMAEAARDVRLKKRTLTNLYNERPTWLRLAHEKLDRAVLAAYAATDPAGGWSEEWAEVWIETGAGQPLAPNDDGTPHKLAARRAEVDQAVLANLLRLNLARSGAGGARPAVDADSEDAGEDDADSENEKRPQRAVRKTAKRRAK